MALPTLVPPSLPQPMCFYFSIKSIEPDFEVQAPRQTQPPPCLWEPPTDMRAFKNVGNTGWLSWCDGVVQRVSNTDTAYLQSHHTTSMFWCADRQAFLHVPYDCTRVNVGRNPGGVLDGVPLGWERLSFHHRQFNEAECISLLGYRYGNNELGATRVPEWVPELVPNVYRLHQPSDYQQCHLAGRLSILLALAAFSSGPETMLEAIGNSFSRRPGAPTTEWRLHGRLDEGRTFQRGLVVQIAFDKRTSTMQQQLRAWEAGRYGPIIP